MCCFWYLLSCLKLKEVINQNLGLDAEVTNFHWTINLDERCTWVLFLICSSNAYSSWYYFCDMKTILKFIIYEAFSTFALNKWFCQICVWHTLIYYNITLPNQVNKLSTGSILANIDRKQTLCLIQTSWCKFKMYLNSYSNTVIGFTCRSSGLAGFKAPLWPTCH